MEEDSRTSGADAGLPFPRLLTSHRVWSINWAKEPRPAHLRAVPRLPGNERSPRLPFPSGGSARDLKTLQEPLGTLITEP